MEYIKLTQDNLENEHICCAISNNKDIQVASKKAWLSERLKDGLVFLKSAERGKCFIEYIPANYALYPLKPTDTFANLIEKLKYKRFNLRPLYRR